MTTYYINDKKKSDGVIKTLGSFVRLGSSYSKKCMPITDNYNQSLIALSMPETILTGKREEYSPH